MIAERSIREKGSLRNMLGGCRLLQGRTPKVGEERCRGVVLLEGNWTRTIQRPKTTL